MKTLGPDPGIIQFLELKEKSIVLNFSSLTLIKPVKILPLQ